MFKKILILLLTCLPSLFLITSTYSDTPDTPNIPPTGWRKDPAAVKKVLDSLPYPRYADCANHLTGTGEGKTVLLSDYVKKVLGKHMPAQQQPRGTCVSRGWSRAVDYLECVQIAQGLENAEFKLVSHSFVYGIAREIGGDLSREDGAVGAWAAKAVSTVGVLTNDDCQDRDAGYDDLAVEWGWHGVPKKFKDLAAQRKNIVKTVTLISTADQARDMICNGYPVAVCSGQGFSMTRDSEGHCAAQGSWSHCMFISAYRDDKKWFLIEQSWGQNTPSGPLGTLDIPDNAFWADYNVVNHMLGEQDSFALSGFNGFPSPNPPPVPPVPPNPNKLFWYIRFTPGLDVNLISRRELLGRD